MLLDRLGAAWQAFQSQARASASVLIMDDEPSVCLLVSELLGSSGYSVDTAASLEEARSRLLGCTYQLLVLDKNLPDGSGVDLLKELRAADDKTPAVMITGYPSAETVMDAMTAGAADYISKPFDDVTLVQERLESVIEDHIARSLNEKMVHDLTTVLESKGPDRDQASRIAEILFSYKRGLEGRTPVLLLEDNLAVAEVIRENLCGSRIGVQVVTDLGAATACVGSGEGPLAALVSVDIPEAIEVVSRLKGIDPSLEIVVTTGSTEVNLALSAVGAGASDYVLRPFEGIDLLRRRVRRALSRSKRKRLYLHLIATLYLEAKRAGNETLDALLTVFPQLAAEGDPISFNPPPPDPGSSLRFPEEIDLSGLFADEERLDLDDEHQDPIAPLVSVKERHGDEGPQKDLDGRDRRLHHRVEANLEVRFQPLTECGRGFGGLVYSHLRDISAGGMFIVMDRPFPIGTRLSVDFDLGWGLEPVTMRCEVVRRVVPDSCSRARSGIGVRFEDKDAENLQRLISGLAQRIVPT